MTKTKFLLLLIFLIHFTLRLYYLTRISYTLYSDDAIYASLARFFYTGNLAQAFHPTWPPLYPALTALAYFFIRHWEIAAAFVSTLSGSLLIFPLYYLAKNFIGKPNSLFFTLITAFLIPVFQTSLLPLSDMLATTLVIATITAFLHALTHPRPTNYLRGGLLSGLTFLTRSEGTMFLALSLFFLTAHASLLFLKRLSRKFIFRQITLNSVALASFFFITSPYLISTRIQLGRWTLSQKFSAQIMQGHAFELRDHTTWSQEVVSVKLPNYHSAYFTQGKAYLSENIHWFRSWFKEKSAKWQTFYLSSFPSWFFIISFLSLLLLFKHQLFFPLSYLIFLLSVAIPVTIFSTAMVDVRYLLWTFPLLLFFAALLLHHLSLFITKFIPVSHSVIFPLLFLTLTTNLPCFSTAYLFKPVSTAQSFSQTREKPWIKPVSLWINSHSPHPAPVIMSRHEGFEFYTDGFTVYTPQAQSIKDLANYADQNKVNYLIFTKAEFESDPIFKTLTTAIPQTYLIPVYSFPQTNPAVFVYTLSI